MVGGHHCIKGSQHREGGEPLKPSAHLAARDSRGSTALVQKPGLFYYQLKLPAPSSKGLMGNGQLSPPGNNIKRLTF